MSMATGVPWTPPSTNSISGSLRWSETACRQIHDAWGAGHPMTVCAEALAGRTASERKQMAELYKTMYGDDLVERLHRHQAANPENEMAAAVHMWMLDPLERNAVVARRAVEGCMMESHYSHYRPLVEIYSCHKPNQLFYINRAYKNSYKRSLDQAILSLPSHSYQRILVALAASHRSHRTDVSQHVAKCDAKRLYEAGNMGGGTAVDEPLILELLAKRSLSQLRQAFTCYKQIYGHTYTRSLKKQPCGEFQHSFRLAVKGMCHPAKYFSEVLHTSLTSQSVGTMGGAGDDGGSAVSRVIVGWADQVDMGQIRDIFRHRYGTELRDAIRDSTRINNEDLRGFLVAALT